MTKRGLNVQHNRQITNDATRILMIIDLATPWHSAVGLLLYRKAIMKSRWIFRGRQVCDDVLDQVVLGTSKEVKMYSLYTCCIAPFE